MKSLARRVSIITIFALTSGMVMGRSAIVDPTPEPPHSVDGAVKVTLFASAPDIVTPIGATVDSKGRLLVIESHTHFRPSGYKGPKTDRIRMFEDTTGAGKADRITTFYEGTDLLMNLVADRNDGSVVVSSRNEIFRLIDSGNGQPPTKISLAMLDTKANYPHNGLHGLAVDKDGNVYFGIGENLGGPWTLIGVDGKKLTDDTGTGSIFRVDPKGNGLTRIARGFWNPFGLGFDPLGTLWAVDNDPDGRPPSRLIQVVPGGDYGFEFRYGRTGMHPLQAWDGELPGTLGMVSGVGEAPCAVQWSRGKLFVSSWRDHQVETYKLTPRGATYSAAMQLLVTGGEGFRPTGLAFAPDGSLYVNDWSSSSYSVNGKGRIWKLTFTTPKVEDDLQATNSMGMAETYRKCRGLVFLIEALKNKDPLVAQAAQFGLSQLPEIEMEPWDSFETSEQRIGALAALMWRGSDMTTVALAALKDPDDRVRQMAVRAIAQGQITAARADLDKALATQAMSPRLLAMTVATLGQLDGDRAAKVDSGKINGILLARMNAPSATDETRSTALHMLQASHPPIKLEEIRKLMESKSVPLQIEAVRYLNGDGNSDRFVFLADIAADDNRDPQVRREALVGLSDDAAKNAGVLFKLSHVAGLEAEALRSLRPAGPTLTKEQREDLEQRKAAHPELAEGISRVLGQPSNDRPQETDIAGWQKVLDAEKGDPDAGRRIFFHPAGPGCYRCHMIEGRGRQIGPDLTMIGHSQTSQHVLESILDPSKEIAPLFTLWTITKKNGEKIDGMLLRRDGQAMEIYVDASGKEMRVPEKEIVDRKIRKESLMPNGLVGAMTDQELRDVVAYLLEKR